MHFVGWNIERALGLARYDFIAVYIIANCKQGALYTGVTSNLAKRMELHKLGRGSEFASEYGCDRLVWFERYAEMLPAIRHEKRIKRGKRQWKIDLIEESNPDWDDLSRDVLIY